MGRIEKPDQYDEIMPDLLKEAAHDAPAEIAILSEQRTVSFSELDRLADAIEIQAKPGEIVPFFAPPSIEAIAFFFAVWRKGAALCPLNLRLPAELREKQMGRLKGHSAPSELLLFTSGSTGDPKIAALSLRQITASAAGAIQTLDLRPGDRWLLSLPLFHVGGIGILFRCLLARAAIVLDDHPSVTHLSHVPTQLYRATPIYRNLRCVLLGGGPVGEIPASLPVYLTYGLTEMGSLVLARRSPPFRDGHYWLGTPLPGREIKLDAEGEILVRGPCLFDGYWENGTVHLPLEEGWFSTGDLGKISSEGFTVAGRKDWMFISGGENIQPEEIEKELLALPEIAEAIVVPIDDPEFGKRPAAAVKLNDPLFNLEKMQRALSEILPKYKIPVLLFPFDELPKNGLKASRKQIFEIINKKNSTG